MTGSTGIGTRSRPSWDEVWSHLAEAVSARSLCVRAQVGAIIVDRTNRIVATGYNGPPAGFDHQNVKCVHWCNRAANAQAGYPGKTYDDCPALHAEANALIAADRSSWQGGTIYVLGDICFNCAKLIANSGLSDVVVTRDDLERDYRNHNASYEFLERCGVTVVLR